MKVQPPHIALKFLRWYCREDYLEEIEGDLIEIFELQYLESPSRAKRQFTWRVLMSFRPMFFKSIFKGKNLNQATMFKNHIKVSWRSLIRQPFFTFLNTMGLAIGMSSALIIGLFIYNELSFNSQFSDSERVYRINIDNKTAGEVNKYAAVSGPLAEVMKKDFPHAELITRFKNTDGILLRSINSDQNVKEENVVGADPMFFDMFGLDLLLGDKSTALREKNSLVLTRTAAEKYFGLSEALGQEMMVDNDQIFLVTGIIEDFPKNSFLRDHSVLLSITTFDDHDSPAWNNWNFPTFVKLNANASSAQLDTYLETVVERYLIPWASQFIPGLTVESMREQSEKTGDYMKFESIALTDIHLKSPNLSGEFSQNGDLQDVYILSIIGFFLLVLASVNFMNLSTAQSLKRAKEVGVRKTLGSRVNTLIGQFLTESILVSFISLFIALILTVLMLPSFNAISGKAIELPYGSFFFWVILLTGTIIIGLLSGSYPALMLSRFSPLKVLKGQFDKGRNGTRVRSVLVVFQFAISVFLIACTLVVFQQLSFMKEKDLGYSKEQVLILDDLKSAGDQSLVLKQQIESLANVSQVSLSSYLPTPSDRSGTTYFPKGSIFNPDAAVIMNQWQVDFDYIEVLDLELISGRSFNEQFITDSSAVILNESAVKMLESDIEEVIGMKITDDFRKDTEDEMNFYTVIGVVKNFHYETLKNQVDGLSLVIGNQAEKMLVKIKGENLQQTVDDIAQVWNSLAQGAPFDFYFMDDSYDLVYQEEQKLGNLFMIFTSMSIIVACLGLFGLASFNAERKSKEIGIRKVLGASIQVIAAKLSFDFMKFVLLSIVIALPLVWITMNRWLDEFSFRVDISIWILISASAMALVIAILTVGYQSINAASRNPVKSLRSE